MRKIFVFCIIIVFSKSLLAQEGSTENLPGLETIPMTAQDSLKQSLANLKTALADVNKLFARKSDSMSIAVADIDYDNAHLSQLREGIKKLKSVRSVLMRYNGTTATMEITYKGKPTDVWDNLPATTKSAFKIVELGDKNIKLNYRQ